MNGAPGDRLMAAAVVLEQQAERAAKSADDYAARADGHASTDDAGTVYALLALRDELRAFRLEARAAFVTETGVALRREAREAEAAAARAARAASPGGIVPPTPPELET